MELLLYDTYTRSKRVFEPLHSDEVRMYTCGPTVYQYAHIGNMRSYVFADVLRRTLEYHGYRVRQVMNITDVGHLASDADEGEDKMERAARAGGQSAWDIAAFYTQAFRQDMNRLNIQEPTIWCRATDHIPQMIDLVRILEQKGYTYRTADGIYFDTSRLERYGYLARLDIEGLREGARVEVNEEKRNPTDFALWKFSPGEVKRQMEWDSPWGVGFPGWHIECSAMSMEYLGLTLDIHTGGVDHISVHHTNEIAQSEAATGQPFARFWLHGEFLLVDEGKMAKSLGNVLLVQTLLDQGFDPLHYRYLCLTAHYRAKLTFNWDNLVAARNALESLKDHLRSWGEPTDPDPDFQQRFQQEINDDLGLPRAIALTWELVRSDRPGGVKAATLLDFDRVFGLRLAEARLAAPEAIPEDVLALVDQRTELRRARRWAEADAIRQQVSARGYEIMDSASGSSVRRKREGIEPIS